MSEIKTRRTEITIETHSLTIIKLKAGSPANFVYCRKCRMKTAVFAQMQAALIFRVAMVEIEQLLQTNQIHINSNSGLCGNSLAGYFKQDIRFIED